MALKGDLASVDLAQVFQMLALNKKAGLLSIQSARLWRVLYFDHRGVTLWYNPFQMVNRVLAALVRCGRLAEQTIAEARDLSARNGGAVLDALLAGGSVTEDEVEAQMRVEHEEEIYDLFFCKDARFEFLEGIDRIEGRDGVVDARFFLNCDSVIMEAARRIDEWSYISERIASGDEVYRTTGAQPADDVEADALATMDLVDGHRSVARIVDLCGEASFPVFKKLCRLLDAGLIEPLPPEDMVAAGNTCLAAGRLPEAIALFERAIGLGVGVPDVHTLAAEAYEADEQFENAAYHLRCEAEYRLAAGDVAGAIERLRRAGQVTPTDLSTRERLLELVLGDQQVQVDGYDALAAGKELVELWMLVGDLDRVRAVLERLLKVYPGDLELKRVLVAVHTRTGDQKRVMAVFESIADDLVRAGRPLEAVGYLQKILIMDRSRVDVSEKVRQLYEFDERGRSRRRSLSVLATTFAVLVAIGVGYHFYDGQATEAFERIAVQDAIARRDFDRAAGVYEQFIASHPLTMAVDRAEQELARIAALREKREAELANERAAREREVARIRSDYRAAWARHRELFLGGHPEAALRELEAVRAGVVATGESADMAWALEQQVEKTWVRLSAFLREANGLAQSATAEFAAGHWQTAREQALRLLTEFDITEAARGVRVPVMLTSRPAGARILRGDQPLERDEGGRRVPVVTPAVVLCDGRGAETFALVREGFATRTLTLRARDQATVATVLEIRVADRHHFDEPVSGGIGARDEWLVAGLRAGHVGVVRLSGRNAARTLQLPGLRAMEGAPVVAGGQAWFLTNEGTVECLRLEDLTPVPGWPITIDHGAATELLVQDGRLAVVDREGALRCWDLRGGAPLWSMVLDGKPAGPPTMDRRVIRVGLRDGRVVAVDAADGTVRGVLRSPSGVTTRVLADNGVLWFGCADGHVRAVDEQDGRVLWSVDVGRPVVDGNLLVTGRGVVVGLADPRLMVLHRTTGAVLATAPLEGALQRGMAVDGDRLTLCVRQAGGADRKPHESLQVRSLADLAVVWEFANVMPDTLSAATAGTVFAADQDGDVVVFR